MALIKSAYELAMEKTQGLTLDKEALKRDTSFKMGRALGLKSLTEGPEYFLKEWKPFKDSQEYDQKSFQEGIKEAWLATFTLKVHYEGEILHTYPLAELFSALKGSQPGEALAQLGELVAQFSQDAQELKAAIIQQLGPRLKQRAEQLAAQSGGQMRYVMERDPEFIKVMNQNLDKLREQYQPPLDQLKADINKEI